LDKNSRPPSEFKDQHEKQIKEIQDEYNNELEHLRRNLQDYAEENAFKDESYLAIIQNPEAAPADDDSVQETRPCVYDQRKVSAINDFDRVQNLQGAMPQTFNDIPEQDNSFYEEVIEEV